MNRAFVNAAVFRLEQRYVAVALQQGRVQLDADTSAGETAGDEARFPGVMLTEVPTHVTPIEGVAHRSPHRAECPPWVPAALRW